MKQILLSIFLMGIIPPLFTQIIWSKIYRLAGEKSDEGNAVLELPNGSIMVSGGYAANLVRLKSDGTVEWRKRFYDMGQIAAMVAHKNHLIMLGSQFNRDVTNKMILLKSDFNGNEIWRKLIDANNDLCEMLINKAGGITILAAYIGQFKLIITDSLGNITAQEPIGMNSSRFCQLENKNYIVVENIFPRDRIMSGVKAFNEAGKELWEKKWAGARNVVSSGNNNFILIGFDFTAKQNYLAEIDASGNQLWYRTYPDLKEAVNNIRANRGVINSSNEFIFTGVASSPDNYYFIAKTTLKGDVKCINFINFPELSFPKNIGFTKDNGLLISGVSGLYEQNNFDDIFVIKTDSLCNVAKPVVVPIDPIIPDTISFTSKFQFKYFPNPTHGNIQFQIEPTKPLDGTLQLRIIDILGRVVINKNINQTKFDVNLSHLADGIYSAQFIEGKSILGKAKIILSKEQ